MESNVEETIDNEDDIIRKINEKLKKEKGDYESINDDENGSKKKLFNIDDNENKRNEGELSKEKSRIKLDN